MNEFVASELPVAIEARDLQKSYRKHHSISVRLNIGDEQWQPAGRLPSKTLFVSRYANVTVET